MKYFKHIVFSIVLITLSFILNAQFVIPVLTLLPSNPTTTDVIKVASDNSFGSTPCNLTSTSISISNFTLWVTAYHNIGAATGNCYTKDTTTLGSFTPGNYKLIYTIRHVANNNQYGKDSLNFTITGPNGVKEAEALQQLKLYPNPVKNVLIIESESQGIAEGLDYKLFNVVGQEVIRAKIKEHNKQAINLKELSAGIYFIRFNYRGQSITKKIIKE